MSKPDMSADERIQELERRLAAVVEIYAGMDGFVAETAPEAYQARIINEMYKAAVGVQG